MSIIRNLIYKQGECHLNISEWRFSDEGISVITGVSGSGKSTLLKVLSGLLPCPSLIWEFKGENLAQYKAPLRKIGFCFQDLRLFPLMTAKENILFAIKARGIPFKKREKYFEDIIKALDLRKFLDLSIDKLSGGEKQRIALARTLVVPHSILFLDEPFSYLDSENKNKAIQLVQKISQRSKVPVLLVSHEEEESLSHKKFYLRQGKIYED